MKVVQITDRLVIPYREPEKKSWFADYVYRWEKAKRKLEESGRDLSKIQIIAKG